MSKRNTYPQYWYKFEQTDLDDRQIDTNPIILSQLSQLERMDIEANDCYVEVRHIIKMCKPHKYAKSYEVSRQNYRVTKVIRQRPAESVGYESARDQEIIERLAWAKTTGVKLTSEQLHKDLPEEDDSIYTPGPIWDLLSSAEDNYYANYYLPKALHKVTNKVNKLLRMINNSPKNPHQNYIYQQCSDLSAADKKRVWSTWRIRSFIDKKKKEGKGEQLKLNIEHA